MRTLALAVGILSLACLAGSVDTARACSCAPPDPWTYLQQSDGAIVGHLVARRDGGRGEIMTFEVERAVKGRFGDTVEVRTWKGGAACGIEATVGDRVGLFLTREGTAWIGSLCWQLEPGELLAAARPLPAPNGRGMPAMWVGGRFGKARVLALDARGRTLAYGYGPGQTRVLAPCPGGRRLAEVALLFTGPELVVRDARTLRALRRQRIRLPGGRFPYPEDLLCESASGAKLVVFVAGPADGLHDALLLRLNGARVSTIWRGTGYLAGLARQGAYLNAGEDASRLIRVDPRTGRVQHLVTLRHRPRLFPDALGRRLAGIAVRTDDRSQLVLVDLRGKAYVVRSVALDAPDVDGDVHFLPSGRLLFLPAAHNETARVLDGSLRTVRRFGWAAHDTALVGSRVFGVGQQGKLVSAPVSGGPGRSVRQLPGGARPEVIVSAAR